MSEQATDTLQKTLAEWTVGNLGEASYQCVSRNLKLYGTITLWCPAGTKIQSIQKFGLMTKEKESMCPNTVDIYQKDEAKDDFMKLYLDKQCSLDGIEEEFPNYYKKIQKQFTLQCYGQESCDLFVRNKDWPEPCAKKIGVSLEIKSIPITKYKEIKQKWIDYGDSEEGAADAGETELEMFDDEDSTLDESCDANGQNCVNTGTEEVEEEGSGTDDAEADGSSNDD